LHDTLPEDIAVGSPSGGKPSEGHPASACYGPPMPRISHGRALAGLGLAAAVLVGAVLIIAAGALGPGGAPTPPGGSSATTGSPDGNGTGSSPQAGPSEGTATALPGLSPSSQPSPSAAPRQRALADREVFGFLPYWKLTDASTTLDFDQLTTVALFGVEAGPTGHLVEQTKAGRTPSGWAAWTSPAATALIGEAHAHGARAVLTIERFAWSTRQSKRTAALLSNPARRAILVTDIVGQVTAHGADGVNLDFEPVRPAVSQDFVALVRELRSGLDAARPGLQLTFDTTSDPTAYDLPALTADDAADAALLLGYDYRVAGSAVAGSLDPLASPDSGSLTDTLDAALSQVDPARLILALPWYGRAWSTPDDQPGSATLDPADSGASATVEYADALVQARINGRRYDATQASAWTAYLKRPCKGCPEVWRQLWYDDVDAFRAKAGLAAQHGLRGVGIWALGYDQGLPDLWMALRLAYGEVDDVRPPNGAASLDPGSVTGHHGGLPVVSRTLRLSLDAGDGNGGTGVAYVRVSGAPDLAADGSFLTGLTFPAAPSQSIALDSAGFTTDFPRGEERILVQWRDVAGNWSAALTIPFWESSPPVSGTPGPGSSSAP
jgi:spore germination protein YaaH